MHDQIDFSLKNLLELIASIKIGMELFGDLYWAKLGKKINIALSWSEIVSEGRAKNEKSLNSKAPTGGRNLVFVCSG